MREMAEIEKSNEKGLNFALLKEKVVYFFREQKRLLFFYFDDEDESAISCLIHREILT